jgi:transcriptional regulator with XRE-family HTH domain
MKNRKTFDDLILDPNIENDLIFSDLVINSDFIQEIKKLMKKNNINTKKELAEKLGVSTSYVSMVFSGRKLINVRLLSHFQNIFNVSFRLTTSEELEKLKLKHYQDIQFKAMAGYFNFVCIESEKNTPKLKRESLNIYLGDTQQTAVFSDLNNYSC